MLAPTFCHHANAAAPHGLSVVASSHPRTANPRRANPRTAPERRSPTTAPRLREALDQHSVGSDATACLPLFYRVAGRYADSRVFKDWPWRELNPSTHVMSPGFRPLDCETWNVDGPVSLSCPQACFCSQSDPSHFQLGEKSRIAICLGMATLFGFGCLGIVGARRFELRTSSLSATRSNQLSYAPAGETSYFTSRDRGVKGPAAIDPAAFSSLSVECCRPVQRSWRTGWKNGKTTVDLRPPRQREIDPC